MFDVDACFHAVDRHHGRLLLHRTDSRAQGTHTREHKTHTLEPAPEHKTHTLETVLEHKAHTHTPQMMTSYLNTLPKIHVP